MKLGLFSICGVLLLTITVVYAQETTKATSQPAIAPTAKTQPSTKPATTKPTTTKPTASQPTTAPVSQSATAPATQPSVENQPASQPVVDENALVEIELKDLPAIPAMRTSKLLKNVDQFTLSVAYFTNTQDPPARETAVLSVAPAKGDDERGDRGERERFTATITRRTASLIIRQLLWDGFFDRAENLQRQRPPAPDAGYLLVVTGMGTADLYEVLPYDKDTLERLQDLRKLLDEKAATALDKAIEKIAKDEKLAE